MWVYVITSHVCYKPAIARSNLAKNVCYKISLWNELVSFYTPSLCTYLLKTKHLSHLHSLINPLYPVKIDMMKWAILTAQIGQCLNYYEGIPVSSFKTCGLEKSNRRKEFFPRLSKKFHSIFFSCTLGKEISMPKIFWPSFLWFYIDFQKNFLKILFFGMYF